MELIMFAFVTGLIASLIGSSRGGSGVGWFFAGFFLNVIGIILAFTAGVKCPECQSKINGKATRCPKCQAEINR